MVPENNINYCVINYCLENGLQIENILNKYSLVKENDCLKILRWNLNIPQPEPYDLLQRTTEEQVLFAKKKQKDYDIDCSMKADPLYPLVKNLIIPLGPSQYIEKITFLEQELSAERARNDTLQKDLLTVMNRLQILEQKLL